MPLINPNIHGNNVPLTKAILVHNDESISSIPLSREIKTGRATAPVAKNIPPKL
jgi:hypothetical protein